MKTAFGILFIVLPVALAYLDIITPAVKKVINHIKSKTT